MDRDSEKNSKVIRLYYKSKINNGELTKDEVIDSLLNLVDEHNAFIRELKEYR